MRVPRPPVAAAIAAFRERASLSGPELELEITKLMAQLVEMNLMLVPKPNVKAAREKLYAVMSDDPTIEAMLSDLRAAAKREA